MSADSAERDGIAALVRAAGSRPAPSAAERERVLRVAERAWRVSVTRRRRRRRLIALAAAAAVAALAVLTLVELRPALPVAQIARVEGRVEIREDGAADWRALAARFGSLPNGATVRTAADAAVALGLARGASLRLAAGTTLRLASAERLELDAGTLYFDSGPIQFTDAAVAIVTPFGVVRDRGTQFEISTLDAGLRVRVREGAVEIADAGPGLLVTAAGEELVIEADGRTRRRPFARDDAAWSWTTGLAPTPQIDGRTAFEVLQWIARETGKELRFADAGAELRSRNIVLSGGGEGLAPLEVLEVVIATSADLDYELTPGVLLVRRL
jgi:hypothetical protein